MNIFRQATGFGLSLAQWVIRFFAAGAGVYELHQYILRYFANEWLSIQYNGPDPACLANQSIANGYLIGGETMCNSVIFYLPWLKLYENHLGFVVMVYGLALAVIAAIGWLWSKLHRRDQTEYGPPAAETPSQHPAQDDLEYKPDL